MLILVLVVGWLVRLEDLLLFAEFAESGAVGAQASDPEGGRDVLEQRRRHYRLNFNLNYDDNKKYI
jgi:hypothetical protein